MIRALCLTLAVSVCMSAHADSPAPTHNIIRMAAPIKALGTWEPIPNVYSDWVAEGDLIACSELAPRASSFPVGVDFMQYQTCFQRYVRTWQAYEQNTTTKQIRAVGELQSMSRNDKRTLGRSSKGTYAGSGVNCKWSLETKSYVTRTNETSAAYTWYLDGQQLQGSQTDSYVIGEYMRNTGSAMYYSICEIPFE